VSVTPILSLRVDPAKREEWREMCDKHEVTVSNQIRILMDAWVRVEKMKLQSELDDHESQIRLLEEARKLLEHLDS